MAGQKLTAREEELQPELLPESSTQVGLIWGNWVLLLPVSPASISSGMEAQRCQMLPAMSQPGGRQKVMNELVGVDGHGGAGALEMLMCLVWWQWAAAG